MTMATEAAIATTNRSLRTIRNELEYLCDLSVITPQTLSSILAQLPAQTPLHAPIQSPVNVVSPAPVEHFGNLGVNKLEYNAPSPIHTPNPLPPPAYPVVPTILAMASALYAYKPTDAGDLALQQNDRVQVIEHMNNDWWRGRNERTGLEGIFPRSYVTVLDEKRPAMPTPQSTEYGNMPLTVAGQPTDPAQKSKLEQHGVKFGKKLGNAAIFGAGATIGSNLVNGIF